MCSALGREESHTCPANSYWHSVMNSWQWADMVFTSSERCDESEEAKKSTLSRIPTAGTVMKHTETANRKKIQGYGWKQE